ncbi:hypothetical protein RM572_21850 [Streptomyces sp. DSM 42041]|uniref:Uncharacterized protein n=1 Tax=Streptomyces hazeniae TaxID=3075538 RepID=A0ABU2NWN5_9ACTN|nr:hypothetical protein [Streptomyces sp. DSM 42041]MDT0381406.1 hypothetical protein [Streptomyces sp. DSM 42041]
MAFFGLFGNDAAMAANEYAGRQSATDRAREREEKRSAKRRERHHRSGATRAARQGQAWEDADRHREQYGRFGRRH